MADLTNFIGQFGDFETLDHDVTLGNYVFCIYGPKGDIESYKMIVGWTQLPYDILLHVIDVTDTDNNFDVQTHIKDDGVQLVLLKDFIGPYGVEIHKDFQLDANPPGALDTQYD